MRLKFYLMGLGIGVIVAAVIMGIAMRGRTREMTDEEIMARARQLGMVEAGTLAEMTTGENNQNNGQSTESIAQQKPQETVASQTNATVTESREAATAGSTEEKNSGAAGTDNAARAENGESAGTGNSTDRTASSQSMVVEGEPVDDEEDEEADESGEEDAGTGTSGRENTANREQGGNGNSSTVANTSDSTQASGSIVVTIPDGLYSEDIASLLETAGVVDNAAAFNDYLCNSGQDRYITVGARLIPRGSSYEDVARIITGR